MTDIGDYLVVVKCFAGDSTADTLESFRVRNLGVAEKIVDWINAETGNSAKAFLDP